MTPQLGATCEEWMLNHWLQNCKVSVQVSWDIWTLRNKLSVFSINSVNWVNVLHLFTPVNQYWEIPVWTKVCAFWGTTLKERAWEAGHLKTEQYWDTVEENVDCLFFVSKFVGTFHVLYLILSCRCASRSGCETWLVTSAVFVQLGICLFVTDRAYWENERNATRKSREPNKERSGHWLRKGTTLAPGHVDAVRRDWLKLCYGGTRETLVLVSEFLYQCKTGKLTVKCVVERNELEKGLLQNQALLRLYYLQIQTSHSLWCLQKSILVSLYRLCIYTIRNSLCSVGRKLFMFSFNCYETCICHWFMV